MMFTSTTTTIPWTPRHEFAARAMEVLLLDKLNTKYNSPSNLILDVAEMSVRMADEMLKALEEER